MKKLSLESMFITIISVGFFILYIGIQFETHRKEWLLQSLAVLTILLMLLSSWRIWRPIIIRPRVEDEEPPSSTWFSKWRRRVSAFIERIDKKRSEIFYTNRSRFKPLFSLLIEKFDKKRGELPYRNNLFDLYIHFYTLQMGIRHFFSCVVSGVLAIISLCIFDFAIKVTPIKRESLVPFFVGVIVTWAVIMFLPFLIHFVITVIRSERIEKEKKAKDHYHY